MIVEPTPTTEPSPRRRALGAVAMLAPVALLVLAVGAGVLGTLRPSPSPLIAAGTPAPASPAATAGPSAGTGLTDRSPSLPTQFGDLRVLPVARVAEAAVGVHAATAVALSGFLWITGTDPACEAGDGDPLGPWCDRQAILVDWNFANGSTFAVDGPPHVTVVIPVGVRVPGSVTTAMAQPGGDGPHVIVVGRFTAGVAACRRIEACDPGFVVDRFAWVDGVRVGLTPLVADRLATGTRRANPFAGALDAAAMPLMGVLIWPQDLSAIDPDASAAAAGGPPAEPVWYLRVLDGARGPGMERRVLWLLLDERRLEVIGSGRPDWYAAPAWVTG
jgi:hypothetical protein